jgi:hypothetical protein
VSKSGSRNCEYQALCLKGVAFARSAISAIRVLRLLGDAVTGVLVPGVIVLGVGGRYVAATWPTPAYTSYGLRG